MSQARETGGSGSAGPPVDLPGPTVAGGEPLRLWHLLILVFGVALFFGAFAAIGGWAVVLLILLTLALIVGLVVVGVRGRAGQRYSLLWMLAIAADHRMPLATTVEAFANQYRGRFRRRLSRLAASLEQGASLSEALRGEPGLIPAEAALLVQIGEDSGRVGPALRKAAEVQSTRSATGTTLGSQAAYLLGVLLIMQVITSFLLYFIVPKFEAIFNDFGVPLPASTILLISGSHFMVERLLVPIWLPLLTVALMLIIPRALAGGASVDIPLIGRLFRRRHAALILRSLAMTAEADRPIEKGLKILASRYPTGWVRRRLASVEQEVARGGDWRDTLLRHGLIRPADREVLTSAAAVGNLPWAMTDLADAIDRRAGLRLALLTQALWPLVILSIGALVLFLAIGFFTPLVELIGRLSG
ncbi:type II secretion system F family protein [Planctomyces sp. SH-PL62]|uniref:type II secretion system F family protein n=1 Tax=Planctomyces sp. SH-PL62 TaxID=1636152 RepID=UPI00078E4679|nr:type II secretion system F family protein [Planctomyces sp. SH-PL62]AMV39813.1 Type II secretion system protein F [Planctomyces sp. SH-PL62]